MSTDDTPSPSCGFSLHRDPLGRLVLTDAQGQTHLGVLPVRAFPLAAPDEGISLLGSDGHELAWVARLSALPEPQRSLVSDELAHREFMPEILRLRSVSTFSTPSSWEVDTDRGPTTLVLKGEEDIRRLGERGRLLISSGHGVVFWVRDMAALDRHSKKLLERFL